MLQRPAREDKPPPSQRAPLAFERRFDAAETARLHAGLVPRQMEDKWSMKVQDGWLLLRRSWTGICIYGVRLEPDAPGSSGEASEKASDKTPDKASDKGSREGATRAAEAWVNRSPDEYTVTDDAYDLKMLAYLIDHLLLGKDAEFPYPSSIGGTNRAGLFRNVVDGSQAGPRKVSS